MGDAKKDTKTKARASAVKAARETGKPDLKVLDGNGKFVDPNGRNPNRPKWKLPGEPDYIPWPECKDDDDNAPIGMTESNLLELLAVLGVDVHENEMTKDLEFSGKILDGIPDGGKRSTLCITKLKGEALKRGLKSTRDDLTATLELVASRNRRNPSGTFLDECEHEYRKAVANGDTTDYIKGVFNRLKLDTSAEKQDPLLCYSLFRKWLISGARAPFNTLEKGDMYQGVIVLVGGQGIGKTRFMMKLIPDNALWAVGLKVNPNNKDSLMTVLTHWCAELGEFGTTMSDKRKEDLKNFFTRNSDILRKPYGRATENFPRKTFFYASTNDAKFLVDDTGDRRYWPVMIVGINFDGWTEKDSRLMWGQVMTLAFAEWDKNHTSKKAGAVCWWLTQKEQKALSRMQESNKAESSEESTIKDLLDWSADKVEWKRLSKTEIAVMLGAAAGGKHFNENKISRILSRLKETDPTFSGIEHIRTKTARMWLVPPLRKDLYNADRAIGWGEMIH